MANVTLKPLNQQVIVITGASSGIGMATAQEAARRGAKVVLVARSEGALQQIVSHITSAGGDAHYVVADVSHRDEIDEVVGQVIARHGRIDTWVNNAGVSIYGRLDEVSEEDSRRVFETNFWGVYNGSLAALPHLIRSSGALINVGSEVSEAVVPLQGIYSTSKHAVKGFTDALRVEIENVDQSPVSITLIQPTAVDTPYPQHAKNYMTQEPKLPTPQIKAADVADAILSAAIKPARDVKVGMMAKVNTAVSKILPGLGDKMAATYVDRQHYDEPPRDPEGALHRPSEETTVVAQTHGTGGREAK